MSAAVRVATPTRMAVRNTKKCAENQVRPGKRSSAQPQTPVKKLQLKRVDLKHSPVVSWLDPRPQIIRRSLVFFERPRAAWAATDADKGMHRYYFLFLLRRLAGRFDFILRQNQRKGLFDRFEFGIQFGGEKLV